MSEDQSRRIELEIEVAGSPEEVWRAIATGPGIGSWFVPSQVEEREGGVIAQEFGPGQEVEGVVTAWEPLGRFAFGAADGSGLAFEWLVEARDGGSCVVRLVNSGFGEGEEWDSQYDAMTDGWRIFLANLELRQRLFPGRAAHPLAVTAVWPGPGARAWARLTSALGLPEALTPGDSVRSGPGAPPLAGRVAVARAGHHAVLALDSPAPGTAILAAEERDGAVAVSTFLYLYAEPEHDPAVLDQLDRWREWLPAQE